jgi:hypothetical protein
VTSTALHDIINYSVGFEVLTAVLMDVSPSGMASYSSYMNKRFGGTYHLHLEGGKSAEKGVRVQQTSLSYLAYVELNQ